MMNLKLIFGIVGLVIFASCGKVTRNVTVERDCTGTYIEINSKDYLVCNPSALSAYPDGSSVEVQYSTLTSCPLDPNTAICEMYHQNWGTVKITKIK